MRILLMHLQGPILIRKGLYKMSKIYAAAIISAYFLIFFFKALTNVLHKHIYDN